MNPLKGSLLKKSGSKSSATVQSVNKTGRVQFNLLPDSKRERLRSDILKTKVKTIAIMASIASIVLLGLLVFWADIVQKKQLDDSSKQISSSTQTIKNEADITKVITIQNQLYTLATLHSSKHITSRIFSYLTQLTPANVNIGQLSLDLNANNITLSGTADSATSVNRFIDTLKLAKYTIGSSSNSLPAFSSVIESSFEIGTNNVSYGITANVDPNLFSNNLKDNTGALVAPQLQVSQTSGSGTIFNGTGGH